MTADRSGARSRDEIEVKIPVASLSTVREKLKAAGLDKETLILFNSDNGTATRYGGTDSVFFKSEGNLRGLKGSLYEGGIRVPLVAYWPGMISDLQYVNPAFARRAK